MGIHHFIETYGYIAVFCLVGAESMGVPVPGETALIAAATYAGATHRLSPAIILVVGAVAAIIGDTCGYRIGEKGGYRLIRWLGPKVRLDEGKLKVARYLFSRQGGKVVFFGRFISVLRTYAAFLAGVNKMHYRRFLVFNAAGGIVWCAFFTFGAYWFGSALTKLSGPISWALIACGVGISVVLALFVRRRIGALEARAELAFPGPLDLSE